MLLHPSADCVHVHLAIGKSVSNVSCGDWSCRPYLFRGMWMTPMGDRFLNLVGVSLGQYRSNGLFYGLILRRSYRYEFSHTFSTLTSSRTFFSFLKHCCTGFGFGQIRPSGYNSLDVLGTCVTSLSANYLSQ